MTVLISKTKTLKLKLMFKRDFGPKHDIALSKKIKNLEVNKHSSKFS